MELECIKQVENRYFKKANLKVGNRYIVYAMEINYEGQLFYYVIDEVRKDSTPPFWNPYPSDCFIIREPQLSRYWIFNNYIDNEDKSYSKKIFAIPEWAKNPVCFYTKLIDNDGAALSIFLAYKKKMALEFPNDLNKNYALLLNNSWIQCSKCDDTWEEKSRLAMVECPHCKEILHNPNYRKD